MREARAFDDQTTASGDRAGIKPASALRLRGRVHLHTLALAAALVVFGVGTLLPAASQVTHGYLAYYTDAHLWWQGNWSARVYDDAWFEAQTLALSGGVIREQASNQPPTMILVLLPLAWLDPATARALWIAVNGVFLLAALWLLARLTFGPDSAMGAYACAVALLAAPVTENFRLGNPYVLLLFLFALAWWMLARGHVHASGTPLAAALLLKLSGLPLWLVLAARREWRALGWTCAFTLAGVALSALWLGWAPWQVFVSAIPARVSAPELSVTAYQNTGAFWQHLLRYDAQWNPAPLADTPALAWLLSAATGLGSLALTLAMARRASLATAFAAGITLGVLLFPTVEEYHVTLMLIPLFVLASGWRQARPAGLVLGVLAAALLVLPLPYKAPALSAGWLALLAYPRLYGGWLAWGLLLARMREGA